jgi:glycosyltransferase involved in cell wall biosynthesis
MRIAFVCNYYKTYELGGKDYIHIARSLSELVRFLSKRGHRITIFTRRLNGMKKVYFENKNVRVIALKIIDKPILRFLTWVFRLNFFYPTFKNHDIVVCWDLTNFYGAITTKLFFKTPVAISIRGSSLTFGRKNKFLRFLISMFEKIAILNSNLVIFSSKWAKNTFGFKPKKYKILHNGIDTKKFTSKAKAFKRYKTPVIGFIGRLDREKGVDILLKACSKLKNKDRIQLLIIGEGHYKEKLKKMAKKLKLKHFFVGFVPHSKIPNYIAACDIIVLPSYTEGFSSVPLEAMAMKKVVVASKVGGALEIINNWENGVLFEPGDVKELSDILARLIENKDLRRKIGKVACRFTKNNYSLDKIVEQWERVLSSCE